MHVSMCVCMFFGMYIRMYVCIYVVMYVCTFLDKCKKKKTYYHSKDNDKI
jgi:hypothetical protein